MKVIVCKQITTWKNISRHVKLLVFQSGFLFTRRIRLKYGFQVLENTANVMYKL